MATYDKKILWATRRGMLELDIILGTFLDKTYHTLNCRQQKLFQEILHYQDTELSDWLVYKKVAPPSQHKEIVDLILHAS